MELQPLESDRKKQLIDEYLIKLMNDMPNLYYSSSKIIARTIKDMIAGNELNNTVDDRTLLNALSEKDIEVILSYK